MVEFDVEAVDYTEYSNRQLAVVPLVLLALALLIIAGLYLTTGAPVHLGIDFTGGTELTVVTETPRAEISAAFDPQPTSVQAVQADTNRYILTFQSSEEATLRQQAASLQPVDGGEIVQSSQSTSPTFGGETQQLAIIGVIVAFLGMSVIAFILFRTFVPSVAIVISAFSDIAIPVALMDLLGIQLSLGTVAALLMLIGYSVDSDILLNSHILRRSGGFYESTYRAMRTGVTMTLTSLSAMAVMAIVAFFFQIGLLVSIGLVLVFGLAADLLNTYLLNVSLLRWYKLGGSRT